MATASEIEDRLIGGRDAAVVLEISHTTFYRWLENDPEFPLPDETHPTTGARRWCVSTVEVYKAKLKRRHGVA